MSFSQPRGPPKKVWGHFIMLNWKKSWVRFLHFFFRFWPKKILFGPFSVIFCLSAFLRPKKAKIEKKSEERGPNLFFNFIWNNVPKFFLWAPLAEKITLSFNFACFWSSNTSSHNLGVMWRRNQKKKSASNFLFTWSA